jgi:lipoprotein-anchoring transpeptidase ErfK/SrfK
VILRVGDKGPGVVALQQRLTSLGFYVFDADGQFGDDTLHAVIAFQKANRIGVDGAVGPETRKALEHPAAITAEDTSPGKHVEVDIDRQILMFVWNGKVTHVFDTSTGGGYTFQGESGDTILAHTPRGHFTIERKIDGDHTSYLGEMWRPSYFYGGYAIHGDSSVPTYPASHGCVRLTNDVTNWAFDRLPIGTSVFIYPND